MSGPSAYEAIIYAAEMIERSPERYDFASIDRPDPACGTPGCALGWIGVYLDVPAESEVHYPSYLTRVLSLLSVTASEFYERLDAIQIRWREGGSIDNGMWSIDAGSCARALRAYADEYHREPAP